MSQGKEISALTDIELNFLLKWQGNQPNGGAQNKKNNCQGILSQNKTIPIFEVRKAENEADLVCLESETIEDRSIV